MGPLGRACGCSASMGSGWPWERFNASSGTWDYPVSRWMDRATIVRVVADRLVAHNRPLPRRGIILAALRFPRSALRGRDVWRHRPGGQSAARP
jgi:hypothetical protein